MIAPTLQKVQQSHANGIELRMCQLSSIRQFVAQGMHQHIGGGMQEQPELVGGRFVTTGTAGFQAVFVVFDEEFCITPVAINLLVEIAEVFNSVSAPVPPVSRRFCLFGTLRAKCQNVF